MPLAGVLATLALLGCAGLWPFGVAAILAVPLPAAYVHMRQGTVAGGAVVLLATGVLWVMAGHAEGLGYLAQFGVLSFLLPFFLRRGLSWDGSVGLSLAAVLALCALVLAGLASVENVDAGAVVGQFLQAEVDQALALAQKANLTGDQAARFETLIRQAAGFLHRAYPAVVAIGFGGLLLMTLLGLRLLARGAYRFSGTPFHVWKLPELLIWVLIGAGALTLFAEGIAATAGFNLLLVVLAGYFLQGLAIVSHFFRKKGLPPALRTLGYLLVVTLNPLLVVVTGLGVFDLWIDFRKPRKTKD
jgi:uncharacterized protein YybS (DUF2232 family)